jgi:hypothetical protein
VAICRGCAGQLGEKGERSAGKVPPRGTRVASDAMLNPQRLAPDSPPKTHRTGS